MGESQCLLLSVPLNLKGSKKESLLKVNHSVWKKRRLALPLTRIEEALQPDHTYMVKAWPPTSWHLTTFFKVGLCNNLEGWERVRGRRESQEGGDICTSMVNSC